jgi:hypothetical protein
MNAVGELEFEAARAALLSAAVASLEGALPEGTPARRGAGRAPWDVLLPALSVGEVQPALRAISRGAGGELSATSAGNIAFCSAESSALMAVNFLAPFISREGLFGLPTGTLAFEREFRVNGVRAPTGPTLDTVLQTQAGTIAVEAKTCEPWRGAPKRAVSGQYDAPAAALSSRTTSTVRAVRDGTTGYRCLDAAQLLKHLLGLNHAIHADRISSPVELVVLYWRPSRPGLHSALFDRFEDELADFAERVSDQPVAVRGVATWCLLADWLAGPSGWLREHADALAARYDPTIEA